MSEPGKPATSIEVLDLHLDYLRRDVAALVQNMATKSDLDAISVRLDKFASKDDLRAHGDRVAALEKRIETESIPTTLDRWAGRIQKFGAAVAVLGGGFLLAFELMKRIGI